MPLINFFLALFFILFLRSPFLYLYFLRLTAANFFDSLGVLEYQNDFPSRTQKEKKNKKGDR